MSSNVTRSALGFFATCLILTAFHGEPSSLRSRFDNSGNPCYRVPSRVFAHRYVANPKGRKRHPPQRTVRCPNTAPVQGDPVTSTRTHRIELSTSDVGMLDSLFGGDRPSIGASVRLDDEVELEVVDTRIHRGMVETVVFIDFALKIASGVAVKVIGDLLSERLKSKKATLKVNGTAVAADDVKAIEAALISPP